LSKYSFLTICNENQKTLTQNPLSLTSTGKLLSASLMPIVEYRPGMPCLVGRRRGGKGGVDEGLFFIEREKEST